MRFRAFSLCRFCVENRLGAAAVASAAQPCAAARPRPAKPGPHAATRRPGAGAGRESVTTLFDRSAKRIDCGESRCCSSGGKLLIARAPPRRGDVLARQAACCQDKSGRGRARHVSQEPPWQIRCSGLLAPPTIEPGESRSWRSPSVRPRLTVHCKERMRSRLIGEQNKSASGDAADP